MTETTTHCDYCGNPLGIKCDRTATSAVRAKLNGVWVCSRFATHDLEYGFFCNRECGAKFVACQEETLAKAELKRITPSNSELKEIADNFPAPQEWYDE